MKFIKKNPVITVLIILIFIWIFGSLVITVFEQNNPQGFDKVENSLWWTIVTMTTVGYGDMYPQTLLGRIFAIIIMLSGISFIAIITGTISSIFTSKRIMEDRGLEKIQLEKHTIICGWNKNINHIIEELIHKNTNLNIVLINEEPENEISPIMSKYKNIKYVNGDYALEDILKNANILKAKHAIILCNYEKYNDDKTIIASLTMKNMNSDIKIIADLYDKDKVPYLKRANVDTIILKDEFESNMISSQISDPGVPETLNTLMNIYKKNSLKSIKIPSEFIGKEFIELKNHLYDKENLLCIGIYNEKENLGFSDFLSSDSSGLDAFIEKKLEKSGHSLDKEHNTHVKLNPKSNYTIKKNEGAIVIS